MSNATLKVDVVSAEESIFSGEAKFIVLPGEAGELVRGPGRAVHRPELLPEHPGDQRELLLPADGARRVGRPTVKLGRSKEVGIGVTDLGHRRPSGVDLGEQRLALQRVVHHLPFESHDVQSTCAPSPRVGDGPPTRVDRPNEP